MRAQLWLHDQAARVRRAPLVDATDRIFDANLSILASQFHLDVEVARVHLQTSLVPCFGGRSIVAWVRLFVGCCALRVCLRDPGPS